MKKRVVGIFFALVLCLTMVPISAFAEQKTTIRTVDQLLQFAKAVDNGEYDDKTDAVVSLEADLDLKDVKTWTPIGSRFAADGTLLHYFSGKFYGNGHTISNLDFSDAYGMIEYESYGFFGYIENAEISGLTVQGPVNATGSRKYSDFGSIVGASNKSTIRDCVSDISFTNSDNYLDGSIGLCGFAMDSTFEHCQSKGSISVTRTDNGVASLYVGGIVGYAGGTSEIRYCVNTADIEVCANSIGGIAGSLGSGNPSITNCYSIGKLTVLGKPSGGNTGGIVGYIYGDPPIKSCYFAGELGQFTRHYTQTTKRGLLTTKQAEYQAPGKCEIFSLFCCQGFPKGFAPWHTTLLAKCSVLYALSALLRKCGCRRGGQGHFYGRKTGL